MRLAQWSRAVSLAWFERHWSPLVETAPERVLALSAPVLKRVVANGVTLRKQIADSPMPAAVTGTAMRRVMRPASRLARDLRANAVAERPVEALARGLNDGRLETVPAPALPSGAPSREGLSNAMQPPIPQWLVDLLRKHPRLPLWVLLAGLALALLLLLVPGALLFAIGAAVIGIAGFLALRKPAAEVAAADALLPAHDDPAAVATLPPAPGFSIEPFGTAAAAAPGSGGPDSPAAARFKAALGPLFQLRRDAAAANVPVARVRLDVLAAARQTVTTLDPARSIPTRFYKTVLFPARIKDGLRETFIEAMAYPRIDTAMYRPLVDLGSELFLPNVGLIPPDSISLLETNQPFIEGYMVGINHEFARELLWREYPTDQRGSYFRQFWDVTGYKDTEGLSADQLREKLYDIPKLHLWPASSVLGAHDNRQPPGSPPKDEVVLSIRGELLKRYPTAVIYAHKADWQKTNGAIDKSLIRVPVKLSAAEEKDPPTDKVKNPLYGAKVDPDITFLGFDLTAKEAKGDPDADDAGWFFIIKERPGEPRFGLDVSGVATINSWNDLSWDDVTTTNGLLRINAGMNEFLLTTEPPASEGPDELDQHREDKKVAWDRSTNAADVAYVLYQLPVLVAVHAAEMLPKKT